MNYPLFFAVVGFLGGIYIWIGQRASKDLKTNDDYFLMGRKLRFFPLFFTLLATQLGGGTLVGAAQEAYEKGWFVILYPLGAALGFFALGMGYGGKLRNLNISTVAEIFEKIYRSPTQRYIASGLSIVALFFILVAQGIAARLFFVAMGVDEPIYFILFWSVLVTYTVMGGLKAVVNTDILQALFILAILALAFVAIDLSNVSPTATPLLIEPLSLSEIPWTSWFFMPLLFMLIEQDMGQRCFAAKNTKIISLASFSAGIFLLLSSSVAIYLGVLARDLGIVPTGNGSILIQAVTMLTNPVVTTLFMAAIFMAVISTADSLLCSISSNLAFDFLVSPKISESQRVKISQVLTLITGLSALGAAYLFENVLTVLLISYELSVCVLFVPITAAIISDRPSRIGAALSMALGAVGPLLFYLADFSIPREILTIFLSLSGYFGGKWIEGNIRRAPLEVNG